MKLTVYFEGPFWVAILEWQEEERLKAARQVFGAEPRDQEILEFVQRQMLELMNRVAASVRADDVHVRRISPKRMIREAQQELAARGIATKAQEALKQELAARKKERATASKARREEIAAFKRAIARQKAKAKHRGR